MLNVMLLARDMNGRRIYSSKSELASALNVGEIHTAEQFEGKTRKTDDSKTKKLLCHHHEPEMTTLWCYERRRSYSLHAV